MTDLLLLFFLMVLLIQTPKRRLMTDEIFERILLVIMHSK